MTLWTILVCGVIRLDLNIDYDRLHELVNHHNTIREMLGHGAFEDVSYHHHTLKDNVSLLTPQLLDEINQLVVQAGHGLIKKRGKTQRCVGAATPLWLRPTFITPRSWHHCAVRVMTLRMASNNKLMSVG